jgi:DNA-binding winged helix-turn-helix (wHTH) protein
MVKGSRRAGALLRLLDFFFSYPWGLGMQDRPKGPERVRFAEFDVDFRTGGLRRRGVLIRIQAKSLAVLAAIVERPGDLVSREELFKALWPVETFVDFDKNLSVAVTKLREILDDSALRPRFIETIPRRGYRFVGSIQPYPVVDINPAIQGPAIPDQSPAQPSMANDPLLGLDEWAPLVSNSDLTGVSAVGSDGATVRWRRLPRFRLIAALALATVLLIAIFAAPYFPQGLRDRLMASRTPITREVNPEAQQDFLKAKEFSERWIVDDVKSALIFDDRAIALEPDYAPAFSLRSTLLIRLGEMGVINSEQACNQARADAIRAVDLDPRLTSGYVSLAGVQMNHDWDLDGAEATLATARRMEPNDVSILSALSNLRRFRGQLDESISLQRQVITLAPLRGGSYGALAIRLFIAGRLDEALTAQ